MPARKMSLVAVSVIVFALLTGCGHGGAAGPSAAATVGSTQITDAQVAKEAKLFTFLGALQQQKCGDTSSGISEEVACNRTSLSNLIQGALIQPYADQQKITANPQDTAALVGQLDSQYGKDKVDAGLTAEGLSRDDLNGLAEQVDIGRQVRHMLGEASLGDAKLRSLYEQQILSFTGVEVEQILVKTQAQAAQVYQQVTKPGSTEAQFKALATKVSIDPSVKQNAGLYPLAPAAGYVPSFGKAAAALEPGQISRPVKSKYGWHVIRLVSKQIAPYEQARSKLALPQDTSGSFDAWVRTQAGTLGVSVNPTFGRFDLQTLSVVAVTSTDASATGSPTSSAAATASPSP